jgi:hypothetical protein
MIWTFALPIPKRLALTAKYSPDEPHVRYIIDRFNDTNSCFYSSIGCLRVCRKLRKFCFENFRCSLPADGEGIIYYGEDTQLYIMNFLQIRLSPDETSDLRTLDSRGLGYPYLGRRWFSDFGDRLWSVLEKSVRDWRDRSIPNSGRTEVYCCSYHGFRMSTSMRCVLSRSCLGRFEKLVLSGGRESCTTQDLLNGDLYVPLGPDHCEGWHDRGWIIG